MNRAVSVDIREGIGRITLSRAEVGNTITAQSTTQFLEALDLCEASCGVVVIEGGERTFSLGADFSDAGSEAAAPHDPASLYLAWQRLVDGPFVSVCHVRGRASAGGVGFVAASDVVIASPDATFALPEMLFGIFPAMVMPFLSGRIGARRARYLALTTKTVSAATAREWGLVDEVAANSPAAVSRCIQRISKIPAHAVGHYKRYMTELFGDVAETRDAAVRANRAMFDDPVARRRIHRFAVEGAPPWQEEEAGVSVTGADVRNGLQGTAQIDRPPPGGGTRPR